MLQLKTPRFTLRTFMLGLTAVCIVGCYYVQRSTKQRAATQWVESVGGDVVYDHAIIAPQFLRNSFGVDYFSTVVGVHIWKPDLPLVDLSQLVQFGNLRFVELEMSESDDSDFTVLESLHEVRRLVISSPALDDLSFLRNWSKLQSIEIGHSQIKSIESLSHLKGLEQLNIRSEIEDTAPLANLTALRYVGLTTKDFDVADFKSLKHVEEIYLEVPESRFSIPECEELERNFPTTTIIVISGRVVWTSKYQDLPAE